MAESPTIPLTDAEFPKAVLESNGLCVVDFWSPRCGPCHSMAPALDAFASAHAETLNVYTLDVDENPKISEKYEIRSVPTIIFFKDGEPVDITRGTLSESSLQSKLETLQSP